MRLSIPRLRLRRHVSSLNTESLRVLERLPVCHYLLLHPETHHVCPCLNHRLGPVSGTGPKSESSNPDCDTNDDQSESRRVLLVPRGQEYRDVGPSRPNPDPGRHKHQKGGHRRFTLVVDETHTGLSRPPGGNPPVQDPRRSGRTPKRLGDRGGGRYVRTPPGVRMEDDPSGPHPLRYLGHPTVPTRGSQPPTLLLDRPATTS